MRADDFRRFEPYFSINENWGNHEHVQWFHVQQLWLIRKELERMGHDWPMVVHCSYASKGHEENSLHYQGVATDFHFQTDFKLLFQYEILCEALDELALDEFVALGVYPQWNRPGFHLDCRGRRVRWIQLGGRYLYGEARTQHLLEEYTLLPQSRAPGLVGKAFRYGTTKLLGRKAAP